MATCKDCICEDVCSIKNNVLCQLDTFVYEEYSNMPNVEKYCEHFKPKSDYVKREWISVKKKLPMVGEEVLVYCDENQADYRIAMYSDTYRTFFAGGFACDNVTHWQPLPEPPKGE